MVITGCLFALYNFWILGKVKRKHGQDMDRANAHEGEGLVEKLERYEFPKSTPTIFIAWHDLPALSSLCFSIWLKTKY